MTPRAEGYSVAFVQLLEVALAWYPDTCLTAVNGGELWVVRAPTLDVVDRLIRIPSLAPTLVYLDTRLRADRELVVRINQHTGLFKLERRSRVDGKLYVRELAAASTLMLLDVNADRSAAAGDLR